ncbi:MAG: type II toxin-antitoxin system YafQ family toxin [Hydrogenophaga sp.]|nr:type II toxin-antitoxin system YafQ family toxin [Hydrogenophaga sp.]
MKETSQFKSDKKRIQRSGRHDWEKMRKVVGVLMQDQPLPERNRDRDHALTGDYVGTRECHVAPDWLLIYLKTGDTQTGSITLIRTGSHSELF